MADSWLSLDLHSASLATQPFIGRIRRSYYFGSTQIRFPATVKLSTDLIASMENNFTTNSLTTVPDPNVDDLFYDSITVEETDFFTGYVKNNITKNESSMCFF